MRYEARHSADSQLIVAVIDANSAQQRVAHNKHKTDSSSEPQEGLIRNDSGWNVGRRYFYPSQLQ